jgi:hypothetical protein
LRVAGAEREQERGEGEEGRFGGALLAFPHWVLRGRREWRAWEGGVAPILFGKFFRCRR